MKLTARKNGTCEITGMKPGDVRLLAAALEALEDRQWRFARQEPGGTPAERRERALALQAERLKRQLEAMALSTERGGGTVLRLSERTRELTSGSADPAENYLPVSE